ncbi:unnamed protein product, partial [Mesorhabditis spiculigera]
MTRHSFTRRQRDYLEARFHDDPYASPARRREIAAKFDVAETRIKLWFQNRRQRDKLGRATSKPEQAAK